MKSEQMLTQLGTLPERAMTLAGHVGDGIKHALPNGADKWLQTGVAISALKSGTRIATKLVRRHPVATVATVASAGLVWYLARRARNGVIEGSATRVEARRADKVSADGKTGANGKAGKRSTGTRRKTTRSESTATR
jgi:hypothetical protein